MIWKCCFSEISSVKHKKPLTTMATEHILINPGASGYEQFSFPNVLV